MNLAFVDIETTGTDPCTHAVSEIGIVLRSDYPALTETEHHWWLPLSDGDLARGEPEALQIASRRPKKVDADPREVADDLYALLGGAWVVGINVAFDLSFLGRFIVANRWGFAKTVEERIVIPVCPLCAGDLDSFAGRCLQCGEGFETATAQEKGLAPHPGQEATFAFEMGAAEDDPDAYVVRDQRLPWRLRGRSFCYPVEVVPLMAGRLGASPPWKRWELERRLGLDRRPDPRSPAADPYAPHTALGDARWAKRIYDACFESDEQRQERIFWQDR